MAAAYSLRMTAAQIKALLGYLESQFGWVIVENVVDIQFLSVAQKPDGFRFDRTFDHTFCERGRAFGEQMEVRWRRKHDRYVILLLAEAPVAFSPEAAVGIEPLPEPTLLVKLESDPSLQVVLWGEWQDPKAEPDLPSPSRPYWYETRIPKFLAYPWDKPVKRLAIEVSRYREQPQKPDTPLDWPADFIYRFVRLRETPAAWEEEQEEEDV
jgi:hypothetical protein